MQADERQIPGLVTAWHAANAGHTLTVLRRVNGRWLVARDANLLTVVPSTGP